MPLQLFQELDAEKRENIIEAALEEFSKYGYRESSTNRIVKNAGISKGSLFKYFQSKEDLYFYILDRGVEGLAEALREKISQLPKDVLERMVKCAELEMGWYIKNPRHYSLIRHAFTDDHSEMYQKTIARYAHAGLGLYNKLVEDTDAEMLIDKSKTLEILRWFLEGFNEAFIKGMKRDEDIARIQKEYTVKLKAYMELLKRGIYKS